MDEFTAVVVSGHVRRALTLIAACLWVGTAPSASDSPSPAAANAPLAKVPIVDLDFLNISGSTVPDVSGNTNFGAGKQGAVGFETGWNPGTATDSQGNAAVIFDGTRMQRIEIPNRSGSLDVNQYSILVQFTLDQAVDTDPLHQRYELMEKAGSFWFNVREDTTPKYVLRTGAYFDGKARSLTGTRVIPHNTLVWAIATYDGARLTTYVANGDGSNLVLDNSKEQTGTVATGTAITGIDEALVVGAKHRKGHWVDGTGSEIAEGFFNGTMSRFIVYDTALTQDDIAAVISGPVPSGKPGPVRARFIQDSTMSGGVNPTVPNRISWTQGTCPSGSTYHVRWTTAGGATSVSSVTTLGATIKLPVGVGYTVAVDCGGESSTTSLTLGGFQEGAASYAGTWRRSSVTGAWGGAVKYTTAGSASATFRCASCRAIAWVAREDSTQGSAKVYVDGVLTTVIDTRSSAARNRVIAYQVEWAKAGAHTLSIVNVATRGHPRISVDGFVTRN